MNQDKIQIELELKYKDKYTLTSKSDDDLKKIAKDLFNGSIYSDRHCRPENIKSVFMVLMFMGEHSTTDDKGGQRDNKLYKLLEEETESKYYNEFLNNIGLIYEYLSERGPMAINGQPIFMSCRFLNRSDTEKMFEYYEKYKELRESVDKF